jgi:NADH dehydrogenase (ubiquinone) 1 beta subcomplex subunit 6
MGGKDAEPGGDKTIAQIDREAIERYNRNMAASLEREAKLHRHFLWRGNKLPPFNIEPMAFERERLAGAGMTGEDRALRRQWLQDQQLSHNEPRHIAELYPKNPIRRMLAAPWNGFFGSLKPIIGASAASAGRYYVPKLAIIAGALYAIYYHLKYNQNQWVDKHGWNIHSSKPTLLPDGVSAPVKEDSDFFDRGFKHRKVLLHDK